MRRLRKNLQGKRLLVDTNILLLYLVGSLNVELIAKHRRTNKFSVEDFRLLDHLLRQSPGITVTPNVLTEVSNLLGYTEESTKEKLLLLLASFVEVFEEHYLPSRDVVRTVEFARLGLTDSSIILLAQENLFVLTDDLHLYLALERKGDPGP